MTKTKKAITKEITKKWERIALTGDQEGKPVRAALARVFLIETAAEYGAPAEILQHLVAGIDRVSNQLAIELATILGRVASHLEEVEEANDRLAIAVAQKSGRPRFQVPARQGDPDDEGNLPN